MSMVSSFSSKDDKAVVARIRSALAATILHDFLVKYVCSPQIIDNEERG